MLLASAVFLVYTKTLVQGFILRKEYINQRLECAAPKRWSKYTTIVASAVARVTRKIALSSLTNGLNRNFILEKNKTLEGKSDN